MLDMETLVQFTRRLSHISKQIVDTLGTSRSHDYDIVVGEHFLWPLVGTLARMWGIPIVHFSNALDFHPQNLPIWSYPLYGTGYTNNLTFRQRLHLTFLFQIGNLVVNYFETTLVRGGGLPDDRHRILPGTLSPFIVATSFGYEYPRPILPLFHYVGPMIENESKHNLPNGTLKTWLDSKENSSVILISMGTTAKLTVSECTAIIHGILASQYDALWSLKHPELQDLVLNAAGHQNRHRLFLSTWLPQQSVLRHSSVAMAILHGGIGGVSQGLYNGIPQIIIPFNQDQDDTAARVVSGGAGLRLYRHQVTTKVVAEAIRTVSSSQYHKAAVRFRKTFMLSGGSQRAADLVEYYADVGYEHLVPAYALYKWTWIQYYNIDVYAVLLLVIILTLLVFIKVSLWCKRWSRSTGDFLRIPNSCSNGRLRLVILMIASIVAVYIVFTEQVIFVVYNY